jgi:hypothetical protein
LFIRQKEQLWMDLENAAGEARIGAQGRIDRHDPIEDVKGLDRRFARRRGRLRGDRADFGIAFCISSHGGTRRNAEDRVAPAADPRANRVLGRTASSVADHRQSDGHVDRDGAHAAFVGDEASEIGKYRRFGLARRAVAIEHGDPAALAAVGPG